MKRLYIPVGILLLLVATGVSAQNTNLCDEGNVLGGTCETEKDWEYGWWWQRVAEGSATVCSVPDEYRSRVGALQNLPQEQRNRVNATTCDESLLVTAPPEPERGDVVERDPTERIVIPPPPDIPAIPDVIPSAIVVLQNSPIGDIPGAINVPLDYFDWKFDAQTYGVRMDPNLGGIVVFGNDALNYIAGSPGNDIIYGFGGIDEIYGEAGYDKTSGHYGNDYIVGGDGNDFLIGEGLETSDNYGNDTIFGGRGWDAVAGDSWSGNNNFGNDYIDGGDGLDFLMGDSYEGSYNAGNDTIFGGNDIDSIYGEGYSGDFNSGNDYIDGQGDLDELVGDGYLGKGNTGSDTIYGSEGNDEIYGETLRGTADGGDDSIVGGDGYEYIVQGGGNNTVDVDGESGWVNNVSNACDPGNSREGQCKTPYDWELGWWIQRVDEGDIGMEDLPEKFRN